MERVFAEEVEFAQTRATIQSLVHEVESFRKEAAQSYASHRLPSPPTLLSFSPTLEDQAALTAHLDRAREQEHKAVLTRRAETLRQDAESKSEECKKLRRWGCKVLRRTSVIVIVATTAPLVHQPQGERDAATPAQGGPRRMHQGEDKTSGDVEPH